MPTLGSAFRIGNAMLVIIPFDEDKLREKTTELFIVLSAQYGTNTARD